ADPNQRPGAATEPPADLEIIDHPRGDRRGDRVHIHDRGVQGQEPDSRRAGLHRGGAPDLHPRRLLPGADALPAPPAQGRWRRIRLRPDAAEMIDVRMFTVGPVQENCFIVRQKGSDQAVIVDPGDEADRLLAAIEILGVKIEAILVTHTHFDHIGAVAPVAQATGAPVWCPELERQVLANIMDYVPWPGFGPFESYEADHTVTGEETLELAGLRIDVVFTPGHSPGHVTYAIEDEPALFSGDVLFQGSVGRV